MSFLRSASIAFVTVSYAPDRDRCALLGRSIEALAPSVQHYIVVGHGDRRRFASLKSSTTVLTTKEVLSVWVHRVKTRGLGLRSNLWIQACGKPIRGWFVQQLVKLALAESSTPTCWSTLTRMSCSATVLTVVDVDSEGRVGLCGELGAIDAHLPNQVRWHRSASSRSRARSRPFRTTPRVSCRGEETTPSPFSNT